MIALDRLAQIIQPDAAVADKALATSLQNITGISTMTLPQFAAVANVIQTTDSLPLVSAQTNAVSSATVATILGNLGSGTGTNGTITIYDVLGTAAGVNAPQFTNAVAVINTMNLTDLQNTYQTMSDVVNGVYGDPTGNITIPSGPYAGSYSDANDAFGNVLITGAQNDIANAVAAYPIQVTLLNNDWNTICNQLTNEAALQAQAQLVWTQLQASDSGILYSFVSSLPYYGLDTTAGGTDDYITQTADQSNLYGQAVIAVLRQGVNVIALNAAGIGTNLNIPDTTK